MTTQRNYGEHFEFVDRTGQLVRSVRGRDNKPTLTPVGRAYAFFNCRADSPEVIAATLPNARHASNAPNDLELSVIDGVQNLQGGNTIRSMVRDEIQPADIRYVMEAKLPGSTNEQTAIHLDGVLNMMYNEPSIRLDRKSVV